MDIILNNTNDPELQVLVQKTNQLTPLLKELLACTEAENEKAILLNQAITRISAELQQSLNQKQAKIASTYNAPHAFDDCKKLQDHTSSLLQEGEVGKCRRMLIGGQKARKAAVKVLKDPRALFEALKEAKRKNTIRTAEEQSAFEKEILEQYSEAAPKQVPSTTRKNRKKKKNKGGGGKKTTAALTERVTAQPQEVASIGAQMTPLQRLVNLTLGSPPTDSSHILDGRVKRWDKKGLKGKNLSAWPNFKNQKRKGRVRQIIYHLGIAVHKFLDSKKLRRDYIYDTARGPMMWITIHQKQGEPIIGKLHFGIATLENGQRLVYHRMFTEATPSELEDFIGRNAPNEFIPDEEDTEEILVGKYEAVAQSNRNILIKQPGHIYINGFTIHPFM